MAVTLVVSGHEVWSGLAPSNDGGARERSLARRDSWGVRGGEAGKIPEPEAGLRLLPLIGAWRRTAPLTTPLGVDSYGVPVHLNLRHAATWHVRVQSPEPSRAAAVIRTIALGLITSSRPSDLQITGIDLEAAGLGFLEAVPHGLTETAFRVDFAVEVLAWLAGEIRRRPHARREPDLMVVIDNLARLRAQAGRAVVPLVNHILSAGPGAGVHLMACDPGVDTGASRPVHWGAGSTLLIRSLGKPEETCIERVEVEWDGRSESIQMAGTPTADLAALVRSAQGHPGQLADSGRRAVGRPGGIPGGAWRRG